jgi:hypothetical protein
MPLQDVLPYALQAAELQKEHQRRAQQAQLQEAVQLGNLQNQRMQQQRAAEMQPLEMELMRANVQRTRGALEQQAQVQSLLQNWDKLDEPQRQAALRMLNPAAFARNALAGEKLQVVGPGGALTRGGKEVYKNARDERSAFAKELDAAGITDPKQRSELWAQKLKKQTSHAPGVNVYSPSLTAGVDEQGRPVFVQASGRPGVDPRVVQGVRPPPSKAGGNAAAKRQSEAAMAKEILGMLAGIQTLNVDNPATTSGIGAKAQNFATWVKNQTYGNVTGDFSRAPNETAIQHRNFILGLTGQLLGRTERSMEARRRIEEAWNLNLLGSPLGVQNAVDITTKIIKAQFPDIDITGGGATGSFGPPAGQQGQERIRVPFSELQRRQ